jgi:hypothetical protein
MLHMASAILLMAATLGFSSGSVSKASLKKMVQSPSPEERMEAYALIDDQVPEEKEDSLYLLAGEYKKWSRKYVQASKKVCALVNGYARGRDRKEALRKEWEAAAVIAMEKIFDTYLFPDPEGPVSGPYIGYKEVMAKVKLARDLYADLSDTALKDLKNLDKISMSNAAKLRDEFVESWNRVSELKAQLTRHKIKIEAVEETPRFCQAMLFLKCRHWETAAEYYLDVDEGLYVLKDPEREKAAPRIFVAPGLPLTDYERLLFFLFYARQIDDFNKTVRVEVKDFERTAVAKNNDYRVSLGLCPLQIHPKITQAMRDHLNEVPEMSHYGLTADTYTVGDRIRKAGYRARGGCGENLATASLISSMDGWKWDGGHHRVLVQPGAVHIGACGENLCGMDIATGEKPIMPVFDYLMHFKD